jgi:hypothetical protein
MGPCLARKKQNRFRPVFSDRAIDSDYLLAARLKRGDHNVDSLLFDYDVKILLLGERDLVGMSLTSGEFSFDRWSRFEFANISTGLLRSSLYERQRR